jgi:hypothetical protein
MEIPDYPSNKRDQQQEREVKNIKRVTSEEPVRRKKSLGKQFKETFIGGDAKTAVRYAMFDILLPAARDMVIDVTTQGLEKLIFGDSRRRRGSTPPQAGPTGYVSYDRYQMGSRQSAPQRALSRRARAQHDFDEIVLTSRVEAEEVIDQMNEIISRYGVVSVADLYELIGLPSTHVDNKWGWSNLPGAGVARVRGGFLLDLPEPQPLD